MAKKEIKFRLSDPGIIIKKGNMVKSLSDRKKIVFGFLIKKAFEMKNK